MGRIAFISHASGDAELAQQICDYLEKEGIPCWIAPRDVTPGREYGSEIIEGLLECPVFVLVLSEHANESIYVKREVERAVSAGKPVLPIRVREVMPSRSLELFVASSHWIDAWKPPIHQYLGRLALAIKGAIGERDTGPSPGGRKPSPPEPKPRKAVAMTAAVFALAVIGAGGWWYSGAYIPWQTAETPVSQTDDAESPRTKTVKEDSLSSEKLNEREITIQDSTAEPEEPKAESVIADGAQNVASETTDESVIVPETQPDNLNDAQEIRDLLVLLEGTSGTRRYQAINNFADEVPERLTTEQMLAIIGDSTYRERLLKSFVARLPETLSIDEALTILEPTAGTERYNTIGIIRDRLPAQLTSEQTLTIIGDNPYRERLLKSLVDRLPETLSIDEALTILEPTAGTERYNTIGIIGDRLPSHLTTEQTLTIIGDNPYRERLLKSLVDRLPETLSANEALTILKPTSGTERYNTIRIIAPRVQKGLPVEEIMKLVGDSTYRDRAISMLKN